MTYSDNNIDVKTNKTTGEYYTVCPKCSSDRKKKKLKCLTVNLDKQVWLCHHCGWSGGLSNKDLFIKKTYVKPIWNNKTQLSDGLVKWFQGRGISQKTLVDFKITEQIEFIPAAEKEVNCIGFNYFRKNELINTKFRDGKKRFKMVKDAELIFYNYDRINKDCIVIVEGEIDCLAFYEAGITSVLSVPNGATKSENQKLDYLDNCYEIFEDCKQVILATDNDEAGNYLRTELARRIGLERCFKVDFGECKDANEYLLKYGSVKLSQVLEEENLIDYPIEGIVPLYELKQGSTHLFENGLKKGDLCGIKEFDDLLSFEKGYETTITGIPNHGKSDWLDFMILKLAVNKDWKFGIFSPENHPVQLHVSKLAAKLVGKWYSKNYMSYSEKAQAEDFIFEHFHFIRPDNEMYSLENILDRAKQLVLQHGINGLVIDPYNRLEHQIPNGMSETNYISRQFDMIDAFKKKYNVHVFLVAHPTKVRVDPSTKKMEIPNLYSIAGSANFFNKSDNGITVYRNFDTGITDIYVQKIKFSHWGKHGFTSMIWNKENGRYYNESGKIDNDNFVRSKVEQVEMPLKQEIKPNLQFFHTSEAKNVNPINDVKEDENEDTPF